MGWDCIEQGHVLTVGSAVCCECGFESADLTTPRARQIADTIDRLDTNNDPHVADVPDLAIQDYAEDCLLMNVAGTTIRTLDGAAVIVQIATITNLPEQGVELTRAQAQRVHDWLARVLREDTR